MQHPFEGVMETRQEPAQPRATRRSALGRMLGAVAAMFGAGAVASAQPGRRPTTLAVGEEGGVRPPMPPRPTTLAVGEEGGATTLALGEEGGVTTQALGEEGGMRPPLRPVPPPTTLAIGEEGGPTTLALGEEGGRR